MRMQLCLICICTAPESRRMGKPGVKQTLENTQAARRFVVNLPTRNKNVCLENANRSVQRGEKRRRVTSRSNTISMRTEHTDETFKNKSAYDHKQFNKVKETACVSDNSAKYAILHTSAHIKIYICPSVRKRVTIRGPLNRIL